jgi:aryl-alcohol dehydrogenase-like predicted oxidoreductase
MQYRPLGNTGLEISAVALGCWPIAGMTSPGVNDADSIATIHACFDLGINHVDTAYMYGRHGESERLIARALGNRRREVIIATKGGYHWTAEGPQMRDARPATLKRECEESLRRLGTDHVEVYYLHGPDPQVPVAESAGAIRELIAEGKALAAGASNVTLAQLQEFHAACPVAVVQPLYNMLRRQIELDIIPWCRANGVGILAYWPLLKGLLAGRYPRDHVFDPTDNRLKYPMFHGEEWQKNQDLLDRLRAVATEAGHTVAELVINWTIHQPGITSALCGAKRPAQIRENAAGADWQLTPAEAAAIEQALADRGIPITKAPV